MRLSQMAINLKLLNDEIIYFSNGTIDAVTDVIKTKLSKFNIGDDSLYNIPILQNTRYTKFDPFMHTGFGDANMWDIIRYAQRRKGAEYYVNTPTSILADRLMKHMDLGGLRKYPKTVLDFGIPSSLGFNPLGLRTLPLMPDLASIETADDILTGIKFIMSGKRIKDTDIIPVGNEGVFIIDSLANMCPKPTLDYDKMQRIAMFDNNYYGSILNRNPTLHHVPHLTMQPKIDINNLIYNGFGDMSCHDDTMIKSKPAKYKKNSIYGKMMHRRKK